MSHKIAMGEWSMAFCFNKNKCTDAKHPYIYCKTLIMLYDESYSISLYSLRVSYFEFIVDCLDNGSFSEK